jgi:cell division protein FtsX
MSALAPQRYALGRAVAMVRDRPLAFLLGVALAAMALALPLAAASVLWAARPALALIQPEPEVTVFVSTRAAPRDLDALMGRLEAVPGVAGVTLQPKDAALAQLIKRSGFITTPAELGTNPLPDVLIARLQLPVT